MIGINLSGGETQKLLLARVLYRQSPVVILDEPTAALDPIAENRLYEKYNEMMVNKTTVFISHRLASTKICVTASCRLMAVRFQNRERMSSYLLKRGCTTNCLKPRQSIMRKE